MHAAANDDAKAWTARIMPTARESVVLQPCRLRFLEHSNTPVASRRLYWLCDDCANVPILPPGPDLQPAIVRQHFRVGWRPAGPDRTSFVPEVGKVRMAMRPVSGSSRMKAPRLSTNRRRASTACLPKHAQPGARFERAQDRRLTPAPGYRIRTLHPSLSDVSLPMQEPERASHGVLERFHFPATWLRQHAVHASLI